MRPFSKQKLSALPVATFDLRPIAYFVTLAFCQGAWANPTAPQVVNGAATIARPDAKTLNVTNTPGTVINWQGFSIAAGEVTRFNQQNALSAVLNRVVGADISKIHGQLLSNGRVFLINPAGILIGGGAVIDTAGFVGSTLNMTNADFLAGKLRFDGGGSGVIRNEGLINSSGNIYLVAPTIENAGVIRSDAGSVVLAAGKSITIASPTIEGVEFTLQAPENSVVNLGSIQARDAAGLFAGTLKHSGDIRAGRMTVGSGGRVVLAAQKDVTVDSGATISARGPDGGNVTIKSGDTTLVAGSIDATGSAGKGGSVEILGNKVGLLDNARVDASGETGGGTILVGGDYQGKNADVQNASATFVARDTTLKVDAITSGDGGKVIVWADDITRYYGSIAARGGSQSGNGGFAEVSGKQQLEFRGRVDLSAPHGVSGTLLLDPENIIVAVGGGAPYTHVATFGAQPDTTQTVDPGTLDAVVGNVEIQATNDIDINSFLTLGARANHGFTARAGGDIRVNTGAGITTQNNPITLIAGDAGGTVDPAATLTVNGTINSNGAAVTLTNARSGGIVFGAGADVSAGGANLTLNTVRGTELSGNAIIRNSVVQSPGAGKITAVTGSNAALIGVSLATQLTLASGATLNVPGTLTLVDAARLTLASTGAQATVTFDGTGSVTPFAIAHSGAGTGEVVFGGSAAGTNVLNRMNVGTDVLVRNDAGSGRNQVVLGRNDGTIRADANGTPLRVSGGSNATGGVIEAATGNLILDNGFTNGGMLRATGGDLAIATDMTTATLGAFESSGTGRIVLNSTLDNTATTLTLSDGTGSLTLAGGTILGGTVQPLQSSELRVGVSGTATLDGVTLATGALVLADGAVVNVHNNLNMSNARVRLQSTGASTRLNFVGAQTLFQGEVIFEGTSSNNAIVSTAGLGLDRVLIHGTRGGTVGDPSVALTNGGTIRADTAGQTITVTGNNWTNAAAGATPAGVLEATAGTLTLAGTYTNSGTLRTNGPGTLNIGGSITRTQLGAFSNVGGNGTINLTANLNNNGNTLALDATTGSVYLDGVISRGTVTASGGAELLVGEGRQGELVTLDFSGPARVLNGGRLDLTNGVTLAGGSSITLQSTSTAADTELIVFGAPIARSGVGTANIVFGGSESNNFIRTPSGGNVTIGAGVAVSGTQGGTVGSVGLPTVNQGTITANASGKTINVQGSTVANTGTLEAVGGGTMNVARLTDNQGTLIANGVSTTMTLTQFGGNSGVMQVLNGGRINTSGFTNAASGTVLGHGTLDLGGQTLTNQGVITAGTSPGRLDIIGNLELASTGRTIIEIEGPTPGTQHDVINVTGQVRGVGASTDWGTLDIVHSGAFTPAAGNTFTVLNYASRSGDFTTVIRPGAVSATSGYDYETQAGTTSYTLLNNGLFNTWTNAVDNGLWSDPVNWSLGAVPTSNNSVFIPDMRSLGLTDPVLVNDGAAHTAARVQSSESLQISGSSSLTLGTGSSTLASLSVGPGTLTANGPLSAFSVFMGAGGTLTGAGDIAATQLVWNGGTIGGSGALTTSGLTSGILPNGALTLDERVWSNNGSVDLGTGSTLTLTNRAHIENPLGRTWTASGTSLVASGPAAGTFNNAGTFIVDAADTIVRGLTFNASGAINVDSGTLALTAPGTQTGTITVNTGATLQLGEAVGTAFTRTFGAGSNVTGGGTLELMSGTISFDNLFDFAGAGARTNVSGGVVSFNTTGPLAFASDLQITGGTVGGSAAIQTNGLTWTNGTITGSGTFTTTGAGASIGSVTIDGRTWNNTAGVSQSGTLTLANNAQVNNLVGGDWQVAGVSPAITAGGSFNNAGTLANTGADALNIGAAFTSSGTINGGGDISVGGAFNWNGGTISGAGAFATTGPTTIGGNVTLDGRTWNNSGVVTHGGTSELTFATNAVVNNQAGGQWNLDTTIGHPLTGTGSFNNDGTFTKSGTTANALTITAFSNSGLVDVTGATLILHGGGATADTGDYQVNGARLQFGASRVLDPAASISGAGSVEVLNSATLDFNGGTYNVTGDTSVSGGALMTFYAGSTMTSVGALDVNGGTIDFSSGGAISAPSLVIRNAGTVQGTDTVTVSGLTTWTEGTMSGAGVTNANGGLTLSGAGNKDLTGGRTLNNPLSATWTDSGVIRIGTGTINNSGTWADQSVGSQINNALTGTAVFNNTGTYRKSGSAGITTFDGVAFNNSDTVDLQAGAMRLNGGGTHVGAFMLGADTTLELGAGLHNFNAGSNVDGAGSVLFSGTNVTTFFGGTYDVTGGTTISGGAADFTGPSTISSVGPLTVSGGTLTLDSGNSITTPALSISGGVLTGSDAVTITNLFAWSGGDMTGSGITTANGGIALSGPANKGLAGGRTLNNVGTATWTGTGRIEGEAGSTINNSGTWLDQSTGGSIVSLAGAASTFNNSGIYVKSVDAGVTTIGPNVVFNNSNAVEVQSGALRLAGGGTSSGAFSVGRAGALEFGGGVYEINAGSTVSGAGAVHFSGANVNLDIGAYGITGSTIVSGGNANFTSGLTVSNVGALTVSGGTLNLDSGEAIAAPTLSLGGGTLAGADTVTVSGMTTWTGGAMSGTGHTIANGGLTISGAAHKELVAGRTLNNSGTAAWTGSGRIQTGNGATINNSGLWQDQSSNSAIENIFGGAASTFNNSGTYRKSADTGTTQIGLNVAFNNSGATEVDDGTLRLAGGGTSSGTFAPGASGTLQFDSGVHTVNGAVSGGGNLAISGNAAVTFSAPVTIGGALDISSNARFNATSDIGGAFTLASGGVLDGSGTMTLNGPTNTWSGGAITGTGTTILSRTSTLNLTGGAKSFGARSLISDGTIVWSGGNVTGTGEGAIGNNGTFLIEGDVVWDAPVSTDRTLFSNSGLLRRSVGAGVAGLRHSVQVVNGGTIDAQTGTLLLGRFSDNLGVVNIASGATLRTTGSLSNTGTLAGRGILDLDGTTLTNEGAVRPGEIGGPNIGTLTIEGNYIQTAQGSLDLDLGGTGAGQFDVLAVTGNASLNGGLNVGNVGGYTPANGDTYVVLNAGSRSGNFVNFSKTFADDVTSTYTATGLRLTIAGGNVNTWVGGDSDWNLPGNWNRNRVPNASDDVVIDVAGGTATVRVPAGAFDVARLTSNENLSIEGGTLTLGGASTINAMLGMNAGALAGVGPLRVNGDFTFIGGTLGNTGGVSVAGVTNITSGTPQLTGLLVTNGFNMLGGSTLGIGGSGVLSLTGAGTNTIANATLNNAGALRMQGGSDLVLNDGGTLNNAGTFDLQSDAGLAHLSGANGTLNNNGVLMKTGGSGTSIIGSGIALTNPGRIDVRVGTLQVNGSFPVNAGVLNVSPGTTFSTNGAPLTNNGTIGGNGTIALGGAALLNDATVAPGASPGTLVIDGDYVQGPNGLLQIELAGTQQGVEYDLMQVTGAANLGGRLLVSHLNGHTESPGDVYDFMTYLNRAGDFSRIDLPAGSSLQPTPGSTLYSLVAPGVVVAPTPPAPSTPASSLPTSAMFMDQQTNEVRVLQDAFLNADVVIGIEELQPKEPVDICR